MNRVKRILIHDPAFIEKRYEEAPIRNIRNAAEAGDKSFYPKHKLHFLKSKEKRTSKDKKLFSDFENNFLGN